jgi:hypothetical protein
MIKVSATLHIRDGRHTDLSGLSAQLWDEDPISDDILARAIVSGTYPDFTADFSFDLSAASSPDSPLELTPDLYVLVEDSHQKEIFRSKVHKNVFCGGRPTHGTESVYALELVFVQA